VKNDTVLLYRSVTLVSINLLLAVNVCCQSSALWTGWKARECQSSRGKWKMSGGEWNQLPAVKPCSDIIQIRY